MLDTESFYVWLKRKKGIDKQTLERMSFGEQVALINSLSRKEIKEVNSYKNSRFKAPDN